MRVRYARFLLPICRETILEADAALPPESSDGTTNPLVNQLDAALVLTPKQLLEHERHGACAEHFACGSCPTHGSCSHLHHYAAAWKDGSRVGKTDFLTAEPDTGIIRTCSCRLHVWTGIPCRHFLAHARSLDTRDCLALFVNRFWQTDSSDAPAAASAAAATVCTMADPPPSSPVCVTDAQLETQEITDLLREINSLGSSVFPKMRTAGWSATLKATMLNLRSQLKTLSSFVLSSSNRQNREENAQFKAPATALIASKETVRLRPGGVQRKRTKPHVDQPSVFADVHAA